jgi:Rrf2 family protein
MISQTAEYALRAVVHLADRGVNGPASAQEIARATKVPVGYLQKILRMLAKANIMTAQRGSGGGFTLAKVPSAIRVLDVLNATDASVSRIERCPLGIPGHTRLCALHRLLDEQIARAEEAFAVTSIASLLESTGSVRPLCEVAAGPLIRRGPLPEGAGGSIVDK